MPRSHPLQPCKARSLRKTWKLRKRPRDGVSPQLQKHSAVCEAGCLDHLRSRWFCPQWPGVKGPVRRSFGEDRIPAAQSVPRRENTAPVTNQRPSNLLIQMKAMRRELALTTEGTCKAGRTRSLWVERQNGIPCIRTSTATWGAWGGGGGIRRTG